MNQLLLFSDPRPPVTSPKVRDLREIWGDLRKRYFPERIDIDKYTLAWSNRGQKRVLASCNVRRLRVVVARELEDPRYIALLEPLLYHEMCHAVLGRTIRNGRRSWHGPDFRALERAHPGIVSLNAWIRDGGWAQAVRRDRATRAMRARQKR